MHVNWRHPPALSPKNRVAHFQQSFAVGALFCLGGITVCLTPIGKIWEYVSHFRRPV